MKHSFLCDSFQESKKNIAVTVEDVYAERADIQEKVRLEGIFFALSTEFQQVVNLWEARVGLQHAYKSKNTLMRDSTSRSGKFCCLRIDVFSISCYLYFPPLLSTCSSQICVFSGGRRVVEIQLKKLTPNGIQNSFY